MAVPAILKAIGNLIFYLLVLSIIYLITKKYLEQNLCKIVGHLAQKISRVTKSWLQIRCRVNIKRHSSFNKAVFKLCNAILEELNNETMEEELN